MNISIIFSSGLLTNCFIMHHTFLHSSAARFLALTSLLILSACSESRGLSGRDKGALGGAAVGAGLGAIIGHATHHTGEGIAIGAGTGALAGGLLGNESDVEDDRYTDQEERIRRQDEELRRQRREIQELRGSSSDDYDRDRYYDRNRDDDSYRY